MLNFNEYDLFLCSWTYMKSCKLKSAKLTLVQFDFKGFACRRNGHFSQIQLLGDLPAGEAGKAVIALGILRSHCCLAGFFENYDISKQKEEQELARKESTEQDVRKAFEISGIEL